MANFRPIIKELAALGIVFNGYPHRRHRKDRNKKKISKKKHLILKERCCPLKSQTYED